MHSREPGDEGEPTVLQAALEQSIVAGPGGSCPSLQPALTSKSDWGKATDFIWWPWVWMLSNQGRNADHKEEGRSRAH